MELLLPFESDTPVVVTVKSTHQRTPVNYIERKRKEWTGCGRGGIVEGVENVLKIAATRIVTTTPLAETPTTALERRSICL